MSEPHSKYQSVMDRLYNWLKDTTEKEVVSVLDIVEKAKAYMLAAGELGADEIALVENYLKRDLHDFADQLERQADQSVWLMSLRNKMASLLADLSDKNRLQLYEARVDVDHQGHYHAGEAVALGELICETCGHRHPVDFVETIQPCVECGGTVFSRNTQ